jgi:hypothetical protein
MNRMKQVEQIYAVLRRSLDPSFSAKEALEIAQLMVESYRQTKRDEAREYLEAEPKSFRTLALDEAFADGGWGVLDFELKRGLTIDDEETIEILFRLQVWMKRKGY